MKPNSMRASAGEHTTSVIDACNTIAIDVGHSCTGAYRGVADSEAVLVGSLEVNVVVDIKRLSYTYSIGSTISYSEI